MFRLTKRAFEAIKSHSSIEAPEEACGVLAGSKSEMIISKAYRCINIDPHPCSAYTIDPMELIPLLERIEHIGFYHSHPSGPSHPSLVDADRAAWDGFIYLIYSIPDKKIRAWRWSDEKNKFHEVGIRIG